MTNGVSLNIDLTEVRGLLAAVADPGLKHEMLRKSGAIVRESCKLNFDVGGRPKRWKPVYIRVVRGVEQYNNEPLRDTGRLQRSITSAVVGDKAIVGTNVIYAPVHQFGAKKGSFGKFTANVPAFTVPSFKVPSYSVLPHTRSRNGKKYSVRGYTVKGYTKAAYSVLPHTKEQHLPWGDIDARPFMLVQVPEDVLEIERQLKRLVEGN